MAFYVGGDTENFNFNALTKTAGSTLEAPLELYKIEIDKDNILSPADIVLQGTKLSQSEIDKIKYNNDNNILSLSTTTNNKSIALLLEIDLSYLCTTLYDSNNATLKTNFLNKSNIDVFGYCSGIVDNINVYGLNISGYTTSWTNIGYDLGGNAINKSSGNLNTNSLIQSNNKIYLLIYSKYESDGATSSVLNLDYFNLNLKLTRTPDILSVSNMYYELSSKYAIYSRVFLGFEQGDGKVRTLFYIKKDSNNYIELNYNDVNKTFNYIKCVNSVITTLSTTQQNIRKWQLVNFICEQSEDGMKLSILKNNDVAEYYSNENNVSFDGDCYFYLLQKEAIGNEADSFLDCFLKINNYNFDNKADRLNVLNGTKEGFQLTTLTKTIDIIPSLYYIVGSADLYCKDTKIRTIENGAYLLEDYETKAVISNGSYMKIMMEDTITNISTALCDEKLISKFICG